MKSTLLFFLALSFSAAHAGKLVEAKLPKNISTAVEDIYNMGRHEADSGGISSIRTFKNNQKLKPFQILSQIMFVVNDGSVADTACGVFHGAGETLTASEKNACVRAVLSNNEKMRANYQATDAFEFIEGLREWEIDNEKWAKSLDAIESYLRSQVGVHFETYTYGYDDVADVFEIILISKDQKTIILVRGDLGA